MTEEETKRYKELYSQYKQSRDTELEKFWKNSMYVWTFLGLCFTAYSVLIYKYIDLSSNSFKLQLSISAICTFGFLLSFVWRWMAQGLKAWYEVFEYAVWDIESYHNVFDYPPNITIGNYLVVNEKKSSRPFSPSALVVSVGCCMIVFWIVAFLFNIVSFYCDSFNEIAKSSTDNLTTMCCGVTPQAIEHSELSRTQKIAFGIMNGVLVIADIAILAILYVNKIKSSSLRTEKYEKIFNEIKRQLLDNLIPYKYLEVKQNKDKKYNGTIRLVFDKKYEDKTDEISKKINNFKEKIKKENTSFDVRTEYIK